MPPGLSLAQKQNSPGSSEKPGLLSSRLEPSTNL
jgi:hypothetical protein